MGTAVLLCLGAGTMLGCQSEQDRFEEHLARADKYAAEGKYAEATIELKNALGLQPSNADVNWRLAQVMRQWGKPADELFFYAETARLDPSRTDAPLMEASLLYGDDPDRARALIEQVLERDPQNAEAHMRASELALVEEDLDEALARAMTAAELDPSKGLYQQQIGVVYRAQIRGLRFQQGQEPKPEVFERALAAFERANQIDGPRWEYEVEKARVLRGRFGHAADAEKAYRQAFELAAAGEDPAAAATVAAEIQGYAGGVRNAALGRWVTERLAELQPDQIAAWIQLAAYEEASGNDAEAVYRRMLEKNPKALPAHVAYARWLVTKDRAKEAFEHLQGASEAVGGEAEVLGAIANLQILSGSPGEARATVERLQREHPGHPRTRLSEIQLAVTEGRHADAVKAFTNADALQQNPEALRMIAFSRLALGNVPEALDAIDRALALSNGSDPSLIRLRAQAQHQQRDYAGARVSYGRLLDAQIPLGPIDELRWIQALYETGGGEEARQRLEAALDAPDALPEAALEFAYRESARQPERARAVLEAALERSPGEPRLVTYLAQLDVREGQTDRALARLGEAAAAAQVAPLVLFSRAEILASQEDWAGAEADLERVLAAVPAFPGAASLLVQVYQQQGRIEEAIRRLEPIASTTAATAESDTLLGRLYLASGDVEKARAHYERAIAAAPGNAEARNDLAFLLAERGEDLGRALELAQEAQRLQPQNPAVVDTLGYVYLRRELHGPAEEQLALAVQLAEASGAPRPEYHLHLAQVYRAAGRLEDASAQIRRALELDPDHPEARAAEQQLGTLQSAAPRSPDTP